MGTGRVFDDHSAPSASTQRDTTHAVQLMCSVNQGVFPMRRPPTEVDDCDRTQYAEYRQYEEQLEERRSSLHTAGRILYMACSIAAATSATSPPKSRIKLGSRSLTIDRVRSIARSRSIRAP